MRHASTVARTTDTDAEAERRTDVTPRPDAAGDAEPATLSPRERWRTLVGAGLGWTFDGYETYALVLTLGVSLPDLLPAEDHDRIPFYAGATIALTLFGFGLGGIGGGIVADRFGRRRTLLVAVCAYALLTGLTALAWSWWSFAALRLLTGVALGSEWSTGATLVAETWPDRLRSRAVALMQSGLGVGFFVAAVVWFVIGPLGPASWRWMFVVGVVPALVALAVRRRVPASPTWTAQRAHARTVPAAAPRRSTTRRIMADPGLRRITLVGSVMSLATTLGWWGVSTFIPQYFASVAVPSGWEPTRAASVSGMVYTAGGVLGYLLVGYLAELWGRSRRPRCSSRPRSFSRRWSSCGRIPCRCCWSCSSSTACSRWVNTGGWPSGCPSSIPRACERQESPWSSTRPVSWRASARSWQAA
jgi:MFS family permease